MTRFISVILAVILVLGSASVALAAESVTFFPQVITGSKLAPLILGSSTAETPEVFVQWSSLGANKEGAAFRVYGGIDPKKLSPRSELISVSSSWIFEDSNGNKLISWTDYDVQPGTQYHYQVFLADSKTGDKPFSEIGGILLPQPMIAIRRASINTNQLVYLPSRAPKITWVAEWPRFGEATYAAKIEGEPQYLLIQAASTGVGVAVLKAVIYSEEEFRESVVKNGEAVIAFSGGKASLNITIAIGEELRPQGNQFSIVLIPLSGNEYINFLKR